MRSNIDSGAPPPPRREPFTAAASAGEILAMGPDALQAHLQELLDRRMPGRQVVDRSEDGSPRVPSLVSVWLISQTGHAVGQPKVVNLSRVTDKTALRSVAGVARLLDGALAGLSQVQEAS